MKESTEGKEIFKQSEIVMQDVPFMIYESAINADKKEGNYIKTSILLVNKSYLPNDVSDIRYSKFNEFIVIKKKKQVDDVNNKME